MRIKVNSEDELAQVCEEALHILANYLKFSELWEMHHGSELNNRKKYYQRKGWELIKRLEVPEHKHVHEIKIEINEKD